MKFKQMKQKIKQMKQKGKYYFWENQKVAQER